MNSNPKKSLLFMIPAVIVLLLVVVAKIINKKDPEPAPKTASFIDPNLNRMEDTIKSKQRVYAHGQQIEEQQRTERKVNFDELGEMAKNNGSKMGYRQDTLMNPRGTSPTRGNPYDVSVLKKIDVSPPVHAPVYAPNRSYQPGKSVEPPEKKQDPPEPPKKIYADMCVVIAKNT